MFNREIEERMHRNKGFVAHVVQRLQWPAAGPVQFQEGEKVDLTLYSRDGEIVTGTRTFFLKIRCFDMDEFRKLLSENQRRELAAFEDGPGRSRLYFAGKATIMDGGAMLTAAQNAPPRTAPAAAPVQTKEDEALERHARECESAD